MANILVTSVRQGVGIARLETLGLIHVTGQDALDYLQRQTTNDVATLQDGQGQYSALLDRKAHLIGYFSLHHAQNAYWMLLDAVQIPTVLAHLDQYRFAEAVTFTDLSTAWAFFSLQGPQSLRLLQIIVANPLLTLPDLGIVPVAFQNEIAWIVRRSFSGELGLVCMVPQHLAEAFWQALCTHGTALDVVEMDIDTQTILRVEAGIPQYGIDMDDTTLFPETGLQQQAVSYTKGCYQGQEVVAKVKAYGSVPFALVGLVFEGSPSLPPPKTPCVLEDNPVGALLSHGVSPTLNATIALARLHRDVRIPGKTLALCLNDKVYSAIVTMLPFYTAPQAEELAQQRYHQALQDFAGNDNPAQAIDALREAIALSPRFADAYEALGVLLSRQGQYEEAIALMQQLADLDPTSVMAHTNLSVFYMQLGLKDEAEVEKAKATTLGFQNAMREKQAEAQASQAAAQQQAAQTEKIRMFHEVLALDPEDPLANYSLGNLLVTQGDYEQALPHLQRAIESDPKYTVAYLALGQAWEGLHQTEKALEAYERGIAVAAQRGDLMPLKEMQTRQAALQTR